MAGVCAACFLLSGCAVFTPHPVDDYSQGSQRAPLQDPFRARHELTNYNTRFAWKTAATTAAGEPLQIASSGREGFRTFIVGSVGGHDPVAIQLTEDLARYLHNNQMIMGGIRATVLRTLNPDGLKLRRHENADDLYLNDLFPTNGREPSRSELGRLPVEVRFTMSEIISQRPQRVVHIRTVSNKRGMLAVSHGAMESGREVAQWLDFQVRNLPADVARGTMESWASSRGDCDVICVGIPEQTKSEEVWALYGDAVLSLLMDGSSESRQVAREKQQRRSAARQTPWDDAPERSFEDMFREDTSNGFDSASAAEDSTLE